MSQQPLELLRALAVLAETPAPEHGPVAAAVGLGEAPTGTEWADLFLFQLHPYASVHLGGEGMLGGDVRERTAGFWRAVGRTPPKEPDHLVVLLSLYAALLEEAQERAGAPATLIHRSAQALLHEHLAPWIFPWLTRVIELAGPYYAGWARLLRDVLAEACTRGRPDTPMTHLVEAPALPDPRREGGEAFASGLLAPVRCGMILTRADLARLAQSLDLPLRAGERRYVLEHLFGLDGPGMLEALAQEAERQAGMHRGDAYAPREVTAFWSRRADTAARLLRELASSGVDELPVVAP